MRELSPRRPNKVHVPEITNVMEARMMRDLTMACVNVTQAVDFEYEHPFTVPGNLARYVREHREAGWEVMTTEFYPINVKECNVDEVLDRISSIYRLHIFHGQTPRRIMPEDVPPGCLPGQRLPPARWDG